jgi:chromosome segregation protein
MKIKRVDIIGFKSFVDRVSLDFQEGATAVVGPNGCGKSNIVDAIRWAMGEQNAKNLRGRSMEDIIFGGSESRKPLGMAEVSLTFSNDDGLAPPQFREYAEIMVTRRLYRNGESEYRLNKTPCRLLDITELFMDTGVGARAYSIIEQGKIGMILNAKPEDRRFLIEEAAGVTKYKSRKKSALRKIDATKQNLLRLGDIVSEVRRQMNSLKRQAQKAERYRAWREELKKIETRFALERYRFLQDDLARISGDEKEARKELDRWGGQSEEGELRLEELRLLQIAAEKEVTLGQERVFHLTSEIQKVENRIELTARELGNLDRQKERLAAEGEEVARRLSELDREEAELKEGQVELGSGLNREIRRLSEGEALIDDLACQEKALADRLDGARTELYSLLTDLSRMGAVHEEARRRLQGLEERAARNRSEAVGIRERQAEVKARADELERLRQESRERRTLLRRESEEGRESLRMLRHRLEETENELLARKEEHHRHRSRLDSLRQLERDLEGYGGGVRTLLGEDAFRERFGRMVADVLEVPAPYEAAVEAVLGDRLQTLLAPRSGDAVEALRFLGEKGGRCAFLLSGFPTPSFPPVDGGTPLSAFVRVTDGAGEEVSALFSGIFVVDRLESFLDEGPPPGVTLVTKAGAVLSSRGELTGGGREILDQGLLHKKREIKELTALVERLSGEVEELQQERLGLRENLAGTEEGVHEVEAALHREELKLADSEKDLARTEEEASRLLERLEVLSLEEDQLHEERDDLERQLGEASRGREERERLKTEQEGNVTCLQEELQVQRREMEVVREEVTTLKVAVASIREREESGRRSLERLAATREELRGRTALLHGQVEDGALEQERLQAEQGKLHTELDLLFARREEEKTRFDRVRECFEDGSRRIEEQEAVLKELRGRLNHAREGMSALQLKIREIGLEADHLRQNTLERYRLDLAEGPADALEDFDAEAGRRRQRELQKFIDDIGEVNLTAIEEFRQLEERWDFLTSQQEDLRQSLEGLQTAIGKINRTTRKRFRETFDLINGKFQEVFPRLFRGGKAELKMTDENDLLETGIEIVAQPPGKKLQSVNLLSGGEKALTAVALIFAIFLVKPSPFCMLDEVDAPLDDANIGRFNEMIREMSELSQFVIITHNKHTMEIADTLYGVTMEEPGVSKLVSVRINEF